jgi:hypothetical protein
MQESTKILLGSVAVIGIGYLLLRKDDAPAASTPVQVPSTPVAPVAPLTPSTPAVDPNPGAIINPTDRTLAASTARTLDQYLKDYYVVSTQNPSLNTYIIGGAALPAGKTVSDPNSMVPAAVEVLSQNGFDVLVTYAVGQAALMEDPTKIVGSIAIAATKDPAQVQEVLHKGGYIYKASQKALA